MPDAGRVVRDFAVGPFREAATAWLDAAEHPDPVPACPASTVLLVRGAPLEVFMIERSAQMAFAPSTWVFPGGRVDAGDGQLRFPERLDAHLAAESARLEATVDETRAWFVAGVREVFEEAGVLLATVASPVPGQDLSGWAGRRGPLEAHEIGVREALDGLVPALDRLHVVDRWVTPEFERRRYDTVFLLAALPDGARAEAVTREAQRGRWVRPQEMLDAADAGTAQLLPPTRTRLLSLCQDDDAAAAVARASNSGVVRPTRPWPVRGADGPFLRAEVNP